MRAPLQTGLYAIKPAYYLQLLFLGVSEYWCQQYKTAPINFDTNMQYTKCLPITRRLYTQIQLN